MPEEAQRAYQRELEVSRKEARPRWIPWDFPWDYHPNPGDPWPNTKPKRENPSA